ncbi:pinensin family lanthipeptide [Chryseobacterium sp. Chry.R1]|uniref:pinensin family lanthipeptide n=1 Tax=Chryseobacterium sp. Chry.R1 TaxID=3139392 RepID=UPI0031F7F174
MENKKKMKLNIDDLKIESFVTALDKDLSKKLQGGLGISPAGDHDHPTHTIKTQDRLHVCNTVQC